jgi:hypothetical protein
MAGELVVRWGAAGGRRAGRAGGDGSDFVPGEAALTTFAFRQFSTALRLRVPTMRLR